LTPDIFFFYL